MECKVEQIEENTSPESVSEITFSGNEKPTKDNAPVAAEISKTSETFKKPLILVGPKSCQKGKLSIIKYLQKKKELEISEPVENFTEEPKEKQIEEKCDRLESKPKLVVKEVPLPYLEPSWAGTPDKKYSLEELKSGLIQRTIDVSKKSFIVFGRLDACDIAMAHPTISRYHAVLQYRKFEEEGFGVGFYIYDLGSTHGTFLNKNRLRPKHYQRIKVGHVLKLGCSTRLFILQGPPEDEEEESEFTVTELKERRRLELQERLRQEEAEKLQFEAEEERKRKEIEERGVDWGMGEDADMETDLTENPYAVTTNEELYIDDPKKTLRGWFEREGEELSFEVEQADKGAFVCKVVLPLDSGNGRDVVIEVNGKSKKEATFQCALEACRHIDRQGLLRQANHESRKKQKKNWEENDFYDSDDDIFLDRTGDIQMKRAKRMKKLGKIQDTVDTYDTLVKKLRTTVEELNSLELKLEVMLVKSTSTADNNEDVDELDMFMKNLNKKVPDKIEIKHLKSQIIKLKIEEENLRKLVNIAKPINMPEIKLLQTEPKSTNNDFIESEEIPYDKNEECQESNIVSAVSDDDSTKSNNINLLGPQLPNKDELIGLKKKKNKPKIRQKTQRAEQPSDSFDEDYSTVVWKPPPGQTGDGRTSLNDKFGY